MQALRTLVQAGEVGALLVYRLDRLSRRTRDLLELVERFEEAGAALHSIHEHLDTQTAVARFVLRTLACLAEGVLCGRSARSYGSLSPRSRLVKAANAPRRTRGYLAKLAEANHQPYGAQHSWYSLDGYWSCSDRSSSFYFKLTYESGISEENHRRARLGAEKTYQNLAARAREIIEGVHGLIPVTQHAR